MNMTTKMTGWMGLVLAAALLALTGCDRGGEHAHEGAAEAVEDHAHGDAAEPAEAVEGAEAAGEHAHEHVEEADHAAHAGHAAAEPAEGAAEGAEAPAAQEGAAAAAPAMGADHETIEVDESEIVAQPGAQMGDAARCPVSGETFRVRETSASVDLDGDTYYFCCGSCVRPFTRDPEQYL